MRKDRITFKDNKFYSGKEHMVSIKEHPEYKGMYYVEWIDGVLSADFYNLSRAKDHARTIAMKMAGIPDELDSVPLGK